MPESTSRSTAAGRPAPDVAIEVQESRTHGLGVFATRCIPRRSLVGRYAGRRYGPGETTPGGPGGVTYLFALSDGDTIDGSEGGNETRFINHSCRPNCVAVESHDERDDLVIDIRARWRIRPGDELTLDYALVVHEEDEASYACLCREPSCRGTMAAPVGA